MTEAGFDIVLEGGDVVDGTGAPRRRADVGIRDEQIAAIGDLSESLLKRDTGCKDSGRWVPGLGGVLDILDSLLFASPVAFCCWAVGLVGPTSS